MSSSSSISNGTKRPRSRRSGLPDAKDREDGYVNPQTENIWRKFAERKPNGAYGRWAATPRKKSRSERKVGDITPENGRVWNGERYQPPGTVLRGSRDTTLAKADRPDGYAPKDGKRRWVQPAAGQPHWVCCAHGKRKCDVCVPRRSPPSKPKTFPCPKCEKSFTRKSSLNVHIRSHGIGEKKPYKCHICGQGSATKSNLTSHIRSKHNTGGKTYKCGMCEKGFPRSDSLRRHEKSHKPVDERKTFRCKICPKAYVSNAGLKTHIRTDHEKKRFICNEGNCNEQEFTQASGLKAHKLRAHSGSEKQFKCPADGCNLEFWRKCELNSHHKDVHTAEKDHKCDFSGCSFTAINPSRIKMHKFITHSLGPGDVYKCDFDGCSEGFRTRAKLTRHKLMHGPKTVPCGVKDCSKFFRRVDQAKQHRGEIHRIDPKEYPCNECFLVFKSQSHRLRHQQAEHWSVSKRAEKKVRRFCSVCWSCQLGFGSLQWREQKCARCLGHVTVESAVFAVIKDAWAVMYPDTPLAFNEKKTAVGSTCGGKTRFPDAYIMCHLEGFQRMLDIEIDEDFHEGREVSCEITKHTDTLDGIEQEESNGTEVIFIRVGVDKNRMMDQHLFPLAKKACEQIYSYMIGKKLKLEELYVGGFAAKVGVVYVGYGDRGVEHIAAAKADAALIVLSEN